MAYSPYSEESAHSVNGVAGRMFARHLRPDALNLFSAQKWISEGRPIKGYGAGAIIRAEIRFDDSCKNGKHSFAVTGEIKIPGRRDCEACGCIHDDLARALPELQHLIRWHLCSTDGPMHYVANTVYHASNRDHNGLLRGERRQIFKGGDKSLPCWRLLDQNGNPPPAIYSGATYNGPLADAPPPPVLSWQPWERIGEGKARDFAAARSCAVWPDATDEQLSAPRDELTAMLEARLPDLVEAMRADVTAAGFLWEPTA